MCDRMDELARVFPRMQKITRRIARRYPEYAREDLESQLLVDMVVATRRWDRTKGSLPTFLEHRLRGAALDWARKQNWSRRRGEKRAQFWSLDRTLPEKDESEPNRLTYANIVADPSDTAATAIDRITVRAMLTAFRDLPASEQVALAKHTDEAMETLDVCEQRASELRCHGRERIRKALGEGGTVDLTKRECEVLGLVADGLDNNEIGARLYVSPGTVKSHVGHILQKSRARNRAHACVLAVRAGLI